MQEFKAMLVKKSTFLNKRQGYIHRITQNFAFKGMSFVSY